MLSHPSLAARADLLSRPRARLLVTIRGMDADLVLAFRLARSGLAERGARGLADAAACPASDFARDAALLALAARADGVSREAYDRAVDGGDLVVAHVVRGAIHALAPGDLALYGRALIARSRGRASPLPERVKAARCLCEDMSPLREGATLGARRNTTLRRAARRLIAGVVVGAGLLGATSPAASAATTASFSFGGLSVSVTAPTTRSWSAAMWPARSW